MPTQTRSFTYYGTQVASETNPETGTTNYVYSNAYTGDTNNTNLKSKTDAKGNKMVYSYDPYDRVLDIQVYPAGMNGEDVCQHVHYTYDVNPTAPTFSANAWGRVTTVQVGPVDSRGNTVVNNSSCAVQPLTGPPQVNQNFIQMFSYSTGGQVAGKRTRFIQSMYDGTNTTSAVTDWDTGYSFDGYGDVTSTKYPDGSFYNVGFDGLLRPNSLYFGTSPSIGSARPIIDLVTYNAANQITRLIWEANPGGAVDPHAYTYGSAFQIWEYNDANQQMTRTYTFQPGQQPSLDLNYQYPVGTNNGQISGVRDAVTGQQINYTYDGLSRLSAATAVTGSTTNWGQSYQYDGFGNLTDKTVTAGSATTFHLPVYGPTNRFSGGLFCYDVNGNTLSDTGSQCNQYQYDASNRMVSANLTSGGTERYYYTADNRRVNTIGKNGGQTIFVYGARGEITALCTSYTLTGQMTCDPSQAHVMLGGRLVRQFGAPVALDRVGSVKLQPGGAYPPPGSVSYAGPAAYLPWGEDLNTTFSGESKFGAYRQDASTGLNYADQRYYSSQWGRFMTADPYQTATGAGDVEDPSSWNRYAYVENDPVNFGDPRGLFRCADCTPGSEEPQTAPGTGGGGAVYTGGRDKMAPKDPSGEQSFIPLGLGFAPSKPRPTRPSKPKLDPCDTSNAKNKSYLDFIGAHRADANSLASSSGISATDILAASIDETLFGTSRIATEDNNVFGLHSPSAPFTGQTGVDRGPGTNGTMATFAAATGFYYSGLAFVGIESGAAELNPTQFAQYIHSHGYGIGNSQYVNQLVNIIGNVASRINCP